MIETTAPRVSVVIPTRNRLRTLRVALASALAQRDVDVEVIVVDEASGVQTQEFLERAAGADPRVVVLRHDSPRLLPGARNAGVARSTNDWVAFLDDDDVWHPDKLAAQIRAVDRDQAHWSCTGAVLVDDQLRSFALAPARDVAANLATHNAVPAGGSGVLVRRQVLDAIGGFNEDLVAAEDWECWLRLAELGPPAVVDELLVGYRVSRTSMSHDLGRMTRAYAQVAALHPSIARGAPETRDYEWRRSSYLALQLARTGQRRGPARLLLRSKGPRPRRLVLSAWVLLTGRPWERPRVLRPAAQRSALVGADKWLSAQASAASNPPDAS